MIKQLKPKKCASCKELFTPSNSLVKVCGFACALDYGKATVNVRKVKAVKEFRQETVAMKKAMNDVDKSFWRKKAQKKFNEFIRERDKNKPCISCQTTKPVSYDAGHYIPRGRSAALAFNEFNCHKQCASYCNMHLSGNLVGYRQGLITLYGVERVLWLEGGHEMPNYRLGDYKRIYEEFNNKLKALK